MLIPPTYPHHPNPAYFLGIPQGGWGENFYNFLAYFLCKFDSFFFTIVIVVFGPLRPLFVAF